MDSILYVDDEQALLEIGQLYLENRKEFQVMTAPSAEAALKLLEFNHFQAIVSDYQMPEMDGMEFLKKIRSTDKFIPFIIFTGKGREEIVIKAFENGANSYVQKGGKPKAQFAELKNQIHRAIDHRRADMQVNLLNRMYSVLSATNKAIIRIDNKIELLKEVTRIAVDIGNFKLAWAGFVNEKQHTIELVASCGDSEGYLDTIAISTEPVPRGKGPTGTAFRKKTYSICNDIAADPVMSPWRNAALSRGYRSFAAFPFALDSQNAGVITFYASEPEIFNDQIIRLLEEQSWDITYALEAIDHEERRFAAEMDIKSSEIRYRRLFETAQDAILILDGDTGEIIDANKFIIDLLGYPRDYFIGKHLWELGFIKDKSLAQKAFTELKTKGYIRYDDLPLETEQGAVTNVEFISNVYMVEDKRIIQCNIRDISDRKAAQDLLQISENRYHRLFETAQDGIIILDAATERIIDANPYILDLLGYPLDYFLNKHLWELGFFKDKSLAQKTFDELKTNGCIRYENLPLERKDGQSIAVEFICNLYPVNCHTIIQCDIRDITDRRDTQDALTLTDRKLKLLSSITRHDILNQITSLLGYLELSQELDPPLAVQDFIRKGIGSAEAIKQLICFANDYEDMGIKSPVWQNLSACIRQILPSLPLEAVKIIIDRDDIEIFADLLLNKVFYNLVDNALRYGGERLNTISFSSLETDGGLLIIMEDNGTGIADQDKKNLFIRGCGKHTGLGLFLSREILSMTDITISEKGTFGNGARFEITVPKPGYRSG